MAEVSTLYARIELETADAEGKVQRLRGTLGEAERGVSAFSESLKRIGEVALGVNLASLFETGARAVRDFLVEASTLARVADVQTASFMAMASSVGVHGDALVAALKQASGETINASDIMRSAFRGLQEGLQPDAMVSLMEAARELSKVTGGTVVDAFNTMETAIANTQVRQLKYMGVNIDLTEATQKYAASHGRVAEELTATGRAHAIMEAVLAKTAEAQRALGGVNNQQSEDLQRLSANWNEFQENIGRVENNILSALLPTFVTFTKLLVEETSGVGTFGNAFVDAFAAIGTSLRLNMETGLTMEILWTRITGAIKVEVLEVVRVFQMFAGGVGGILAFIGSIWDDLSNKRLPDFGKAMQATEASWKESDKAIRNTGISMQMIEYETEEHIRQLKSPEWQNHVETQNKLTASFDKGRNSLGDFNRQFRTLTPDIKAQQDELAKLEGVLATLGNQYEEAYLAAKEFGSGTQEADVRKLLQALEAQLAKTKELTEEQKQQWREEGENLARGILDWKNYTAALELVRKTEDERYQQAIKNEQNLQTVRQAVNAEAVRLTQTSIEAQISLERERTQEVARQLWAQTNGTEEAWKATQAVVEQLWANTNLRIQALHDQETVAYQTELDKQQTAVLAFLSGGEIAYQNYWAQLQAMIDSYFLRLLEQEGLSKEQREAIQRGYEQAYGVFLMNRAAADQEYGLKQIRGEEDRAARANSIWNTYEAQELYRHNVRVGLWEQEQAQYLAMQTAKLTEDERFNALALSYAANTAREKGNILDYFLIKVRSASDEENRIWKQVGELATASYNALTGAVAETFSAIGHQLILHEGSWSDFADHLKTIWANMLGTMVDAIANFLAERAVGGLLDFLAGIFESTGALGGLLPGFGGVITGQGEDSIFGNWLGFGGTLGRWLGEWIGGRQGGAIGDIIGGAVQQVLMQTVGPMIMQWGAQQIASLIVTGTLAPAGGLGGAFTGIAFLDTLAAGGSFMTAAVNGVLQAINALAGTSFATGATTLGGAVSSIFGGAAGGGTAGALGTGGITAGFSLSGALMGAGAAVPIAGAITLLTTILMDELADPGGRRSMAENFNYLAGTSMPGWRNYVQFGAMQLDRIHEGMTEEEAWFAFMAARAGLKAVSLMASPLAMQGRREAGVEYSRYPGAAEQAMEAMPRLWLATIRAQDLLVREFDWHPEDFRVPRLAYGGMPAEMWSDLYGTPSEAFIANFRMMTPASLGTQQAYEQAMMAVETYASGGWEGRWEGIPGGTLYLNPQAALGTLGGYGGFTEVPYAETAEGVTLPGILWREEQRLAGVPTSYLYSPATMAAMAQIQRGQMEGGLLTFLRAIGDFASTPLGTLIAGLPQPAEPDEFAEGGPVQRTGLALVHEGEYVIPAQQVERARDLFGLYSPAMGPDGRMYLGGWREQRDPDEFLQALARGVDPNTIPGPDKIFASRYANGAWQTPELAFQKIGASVNDPTFLEAGSRPTMAFTVFPNVYQNPFHLESIVWHQIGRARLRNGEWVDQGGMIDPVMAGGASGAWTPSYVSGPSGNYLYYSSAGSTAFGSINYRQRVGGAGRPIGPPEQMHFPLGQQLINIDLAAGAGSDGWAMLGQTLDQHQIHYTRSRDGLTWSNPLVLAADPTQILLSPHFHDKTDTTFRMLYSKNFTSIMDAGPYAWDLEAQSVNARVPQYAEGGPVQRTGPAMLHQGEYVIPASGLPHYQDGGFVRDTGPAIVHEGEMVVPRELVPASGIYLPGYQMSPPQWGPDYLLYSSGILRREDLTAFQEARQRGDDPTLIPGPGKIYAYRFIGPNQIAWPSLALERIGASLSDPTFLGATMATLDTMAFTVTPNVFFGDPLGNPWRSLGRARWRNGHWVDQGVQIDPLAAGGAAGAVSGSFVSSPSGNYIYYSSGLPSFYIQTATGEWTPGSAMNYRQRVGGAGRPIGPPEILHIPNNTQLYDIDVAVAGGSGWAMVGTPPGYGQINYYRSANGVDWQDPIILQTTLGLPEGLTAGTFRQPRFFDDSYSMFNVVYSHGGRLEHIGPFPWALTSDALPPVARDGAWRTREGFYYLHDNERILKPDDADRSRAHDDDGGGITVQIEPAVVQITIDGRVIGEATVTYLNAIASSGGRAIPAEIIYTRNRG